MSKKDPPRISALSTAVSDLIRAAHGGEAHNVPDEDLDRYVADLILKEAAAKKEKYDRVGVRAYQPNHASQPPNRLNKRFLMNVVKSTDTHNQALLRQEREEEEARRARRIQQEEEDNDRHHHKRRKRHASPRDSSRETKQRHHHRHYGEDDMHTKAPKTDNPRAADTSSRSPQVQVRGRGRAQAASSFTAMDRHFSDQYNPLFDIESDPEAPVLNEIESRKKEKKVKKEKRKKDKKKKKKKKRHHSSSDDDRSSQDEVTVQPPPPTRAWDIGKEPQ
ncbi:hypothetical protein BCR43DRAFT_524469 [Syncephalastrum racemosum]|uniref:Uncharacterized protein n=1 Tax=Syncephalastrum racemosum TaxID=13706 RepID=A0A1X2HC37_SYNRA|nr:hypothetical protein BCR43DRAFT_524469 [Syncephalastrum racemosum]